MAGGSGEGASQVEGVGGEGVGLLAGDGAEGGPGSPVAGDAAGVQPDQLVSVADCEVVGVAALLEAADDEGVVDEGAGLKNLDDALDDVGSAGGEVHWSFAVE